MKTLITIIVATVLGLSAMPGDTDQRRKKYRIEQDINKLPFTYKNMIYNIDAAVEGGAYIFSDEALAAFSSTSCESSCHVKGNHLAPKGIQAGTGTYTDENGVRRRAEYFPKEFIVDAPKINSPQVENSVYRKRVLHDCITDLTGQASEQFGFFAHDLDWTSVRNNPVYKNYMAIIFGDDEVTALRITILLVTFEESVVSRNQPFQLWANGKEMDKNFYDWLDLFEANCESCHNGKDLGGEGLIMGKVVAKTGTDLSFLRSKEVAVRSVYNNDAFDKYGWTGSYSSLWAFYKKHLQNEEIYLSVIERRRLYAGIKKYLND